MSYDTWSSDDAQCSVVRENVRAAQDRPAGVGVNVTLPGPLYDWLSEYAQRQGTSMSGVVRALVAAYKADEDNRRGR